LKFIRRIYNQFNTETKELTQRLERLLGFIPTNLSIFKLAFKHTSRTTDAHTSNERLEYLGDAVLGAIVTEYLFRKYPLKGEGFLTEMRAKIVNRKQLGDIGDRLLLKDFLDYDKSYVTVNSTMLGNALEALVGAIYLDAGYEKTQKFVFDRIILPYIDLDELDSNDINFKSRLFEWSQKFEKKLTLDVVEEKMVNKTRIFVVAAYVDGKLVGKGEGRNKKDAQKNAAKEVYEKLNVAAEMLDSTK
jgi:ribonuclease-3